jgi:multicomponent Na+:H+ antiporter subunit D
MSWLVASPLVIPLAVASVLLVWRPVAPLQRAVSVAGAGLLLIASIALLAAVSQQGVLVVQAGNWPAPFGISLVADHLSAIMVLINAILGLAVAIYAWQDIDEAREALGYHPLYHVLLLGINGAFLTGDLFNLYVWFEVLLIAAFVLLSLGGGRRQMLGSIKYVAINLLSSVFFLIAIGMLYGMTGTLNMADLALRLGDVPTGLVTTVAMLLMVAFGIKAAVFPLFFYLPSSYHTPPVAVSAFFAGMLTKVGVYALIRAFTLLFVEDVGYTHTVLLVIAGFTMVVGVLGAVAQNEFRRLLAFHIISQIGYMIMGLALFTPLALLGAVFYVVHNIIAKSNLFLISGIAYRLLGTFELKQLGGLYRQAPRLAVLFVISAFALAGFPPLSGFWGKLILLRAGFEIGQYLIVAIGLGVGMLTLFSMTKIWAEAFWKPAPQAVSESPGRWPALYLPVVGLAALSIVLGLWIEPIYTLMARAAEELMNPALYIEAVLGVRP